MSYQVHSLATRVHWVLQAHHHCQCVLTAQDLLVMAVSPLKIPRSLHAHKKVATFISRTLALPLKQHTTER